MPEAKYQCTNQACPIGSREDLGFFTGGLSEEGRATLGLDPEAEIGEGICPNCGVKGKKVGKFEPLAGEDPLQPLHDQVAKRVDDPDDELGPEGAQPALEELVAAEAGEED
jgi:hypothetical protein